MPNEATYPTPGVIFVHSKLDEMGLSPAQFRVFCHIARRGECFACLESIANVCRLHPDTVAACLKFLVASGMVARTTRPGLSSVYTICPMSNWAPPRNEGAPETEGHPKRRVTGPPKPRGTHPPETKGYEGYPYKVNPLKEDCVCAESPEIELPRGFPKTEPEARTAAAFAGCPEDFAALTWNKAMGRSGHDAKGQPIASWRHYLAAEWSMNRSREAEHQRRGSNNKTTWTQPPARNANTRPDYSKGF